MKKIHAPLNLQERFTVRLCALAVLFFSSISVAAQSTDPQYPWPVRTNEITGAITPRDLGDARLTRYFYSCSGTPGDLIISVESRNLEGDVDVFTASTLRPLAKLPMYAGTTSSSGSKTIYLRTRESLIVRVEARTPNDDNGSFRIRFDGTFEPIGSDVPDPEIVIPTVSSAGTTGKKGRRVTATGARIDEPEPQPEPTAAVETETTTPATPPSETSATVDTPTETVEAAKPTTPRPRTPRNRRARTPTARSTRTRPTARAQTPEPPTAEAAVGPRLIIEMRDGMRVERYMTTVRRVTVENGQIVVITKDGKIDRQPMSNILRMAIEP